MSVPLTIKDPQVADSVYTRIMAEKYRRLESNPKTLLKFQDDPLGFVKWAWRWGLPGPLERFEGPDKWQEEFLTDLGEQVKKRAFDGRNPVDPIRMSVSAGKGVGKSVLVGMLCTWIMETWPFCQGTITANTFSQLESKTWATIQQWFKTSRPAGNFVIGGGSITHRLHGKSWMCTPQTCREENAESFAGQHAANSVQFYIFDESSGIPPKIWETAISGMVDGMPMMFAFGNSTRSNGMFYRVNFGDERERWKTRVVDARDCNIPNKKTIQDDIDHHGEDSDYARVYIKGLPPNASDMQYIASDVVYAAQKRIATVLSDEPLIAGVDLARGGGDNAVIRFRKGDDARTLPPIVIPGEVVRDSMLLVAKLADLADQKHNGEKVHTWFLDGTGVGGPIIDRLVQIGHKNMIEIQFGGRCPDDKHYANMRAYMWAKMRDWLKVRGAIDGDKRLETDLTNQGLGKPDKTDRIVLESKQSMKKRGLDSPDDGDALCFVAGTLVETPGGPVSIEEIKTGDEVVTPFGVSTVEIKHISEADRLTSVRFSNRSELCGKGSHEIFTFSSGPKRLDALSLTDEVDILSRWRLYLWRAVSLSFMGDRSFGFKRAAFTSSLAGRVTRKDFCIEGCTRTTTALFRMTSGFITRMRIGAIALTQRILNSGIPVTTNGITWPSAYLIQQPEQRMINVLNGPGLQPRNGMDLQKESSGTANTGRKSGKPESQSMRSVRSAEMDTLPTSREDPSFAPTRALNRLPLGDTLRSPGNVRTAARNLWLIVIGRRPVVPVSVVTENVLPTKTYNLTLREHNAYYANGILVFNCLTFAQPVRPPRMEREQKTRTWDIGEQHSQGWMG